MLFKNEQEKEAGWEVMYGYFEDFELELFDRIVRMARKEKKIGERAIQRLEQDFEEYIRTCREIFEKDKNSFNIAKVEERLPKNQWVLSNQKEREDSISSEITEKELLDLFANPAESGLEDFQNDIQKRLKKIDIM